MIIPPPLITLRPFLSMLLLALVATSCSISRRVPEGKYLVDKVDVEIDRSSRASVQTGDVMPFVRQRANKKVLGLRFHLRLYNAANPYRQRGISRWLKTVGEEPVVLDTFLTARSTNNIARFLESKGYYNALVSDTTIFRRNQRATIIYSITPNSPYRIVDLNHAIEDEMVRNVVLNDSTNSLLRKGIRFDTDILNSERSRVEGLLREAGYFYFSRDFITFTADTTLGNLGVRLEFQIRNRIARNPFGEPIVKNFRRYKVGDIYIYPNYDPLQFLQQRQSNLLDSIEYKGLNFVYSGQLGIQPQVLNRVNLIRTGELYRESVVNRTRSNFGSLLLYRMVNIHFDAQAEEPVESDSPFMLFADDTSNLADQLGILTCHIQLTPHTLQSYQVDLSGTTSSQEYGLETNVNYQHKNIFRGAEILDVKFKGEFKVIEDEAGRYRNAMEYGSIVGLNIPWHVKLHPFPELENKYRPRTLISAQYNYQERPEYTRTIAGMNFGYSWGDGRYITHSIVPAEVSVINIYAITPEFSQEIEGTNRANSFKNQVITTSGYGFSLSNQNFQRRTSYTNFRFNTELSGNVMSLVHPIFADVSEDGTRKIFNTSFSQFVRGDMSIIHNRVIDKFNAFAYRAYIGMGLPYGNSTAMPFEKQYFSGGTGLRAWRARSIGPGSYVYEGSNIPNQTADIKLEANLEYRFTIISTLEGAMFLDAGNIWAISSADERPGAVFGFNSFYRQIALGTGLGLRINLGFFLFRFDVGVKVYDPGIRVEQGATANAQWIPFQRGYQRSDFVPHFGIGYPF